MFEYIIIAILLGLYVHERYLHTKTQKVLTNHLSRVNAGYTAMPDVEPDKPQLPADYLTEEQVDKTLRESLGDDVYRQMLSEQNYGRV